MCSVFFVLAYKFIIYNKKNKNKEGMSQYKQNIIKDKIQLSKYRDWFLLIGTNKAKRRLAKLGKSNEVAQALYLAMCAEDAYSCIRIYRHQPQGLEKRRDELWDELIRLFRRNGWVFGKHKIGEHSAGYLCFEIPGCEPIMWYLNNFTITSKNIPEYKITLKQCEEFILDRLEKACVGLVEVLEEDYVAAVKKDPHVLSQISGATDRVQVEAVRAGNYQEWVLALCTAEVCARMREELVIKEIIE